VVRAPATGEDLAALGLHVGGSGRRRVYPKIIETTHAPIDIANPPRSKRSPKSCGPTSEKFLNIALMRLAKAVDSICKLLPKSAAWKAIVES
jgi:hypothetical protein